MKSQRTMLEIIAPSIEEAIEKGLVDLGLPREAVEIEVLDEGSRGLFGLGSRQARVRLTLKEPPPSKPEEPSALPKEPTPTPLIVEEVIEEIIEEEEDPSLRVARETVSELLEKMKIEAHVSARFGEPDEGRGRIPVHVDVQGDDLSVLIGKRSETLNALQYITRLIVNKELGQAVMLVIDVEGYRTRREQQLRRLAQRMAEQAIKTQRRQTLEPMPANERRIVHMELRHHPEVTTESFGEEPNRKVTITPKV